MKSDVYATIER